MRDFTVSMCDIRNQWLLGVYEELTSFFHETEFDEMAYRSFTRVVIHSSAGYLPVAGLGAFAPQHAGSIGTSLSLGLLSDRYAHRCLPFVTPRLVQTASDACWVEQPVRRMASA